MSVAYCWHPHSGMATVTEMLEGSVCYAETTGSPPNALLAKVATVVAANPRRHAKLGECAFEVRACEYGRFAHQTLAANQLARSVMGDGQPVTSGPIFKSEVSRA